MRRFGILFAIVLMILLADYGFAQVVDVEKWADGSAVVEGYAPTSCWLGVTAIIDGREIDLRTRQVNGTFREIYTIPLRESVNALLHGVTWIASLWRTRGQDDHGYHLVGLLAADSDPPPNDSESSTGAKRSPPVAVTGPAWTESFETTAVGRFPHEWSADANATSNSTNFVDGAQSSSGNRSLRLFGSNGRGASWAALAYRAIDVPPPFEVQIDVRNGSDQMNGQQPFRAGIGLRHGTHWSNPARRFLAFDADGYVVDTVGDALVRYDTERWYRLKIRYERPTTSQVRLSYWIDDVLVSSTVVPSGDAESTLDHLEVHVAQGVAWFDNIQVTAMSSN